MHENHSRLILMLGFFSVPLNVGGYRILGVFPFHAPSHFVMFETAMKGLASRGHRVDVVSHFPSKKPRENYNDIISLAGKSQVLTNNVSFEVFRSNGMEEYGIDFIGNQVCDLLGIPEMQNLIKNPPKDPPYDLVITEFFYAGCYFAFGRSLNAPIIAMSSSGLLHHSEKAFGNPPETAYVPLFNEGSIMGMNFFERFENFVSTVGINLIVKDSTEVQNDMVKRYFGPDTPVTSELEEDLSLLLVNCHHSLNGIRPTTPAVVEVGGLHIQEKDIELPQGLKKWLDESTEGFIYISFGTILKAETLPKNIIDELYSGFEKVKPIRVLFKVSSPEDLPPGLPDNVLTMKWIPQMQILQHKNVRGFVTHCGLMGVQEAVAFGVPIIGIPMFGDQPRNVKNCVEKGVAVRLDYENITEYNFVGAVNAVVYDPKYKENMMKLSSEFLDRPTDPLNTAIFWIEYVIEHGGDSLRSPAVKMTWWQLELLDIYASIIVGLIVFSYLLKFFLSILIRRIFRKKITRPIQLDKIN
ncbi:UDP-glucosyltransferase 2-like [Athalia rosae]|uniref:UDP-glucosyltransferase 2-like n=1 Tax=Athalia rosae TaxID=37344 RepID=UPI0020349E74|nr:UDP-glucosyltransferase 2-like [Athalia rosae]